MAPPTTAPFNYVPIVAAYQSAAAPYNTAMVSLMTLKSPTNQQLDGALQAAAQAAVTFQPPLDDIERSLPNGSARLEAAALGMDEAPLAIDLGTADGTVVALEADDTAVQGDQQQLTLADQQYGASNSLVVEFQQDLSRAQAQQKTDDSRLQSDLTTAFNDLSQDRQVAANLRSAIGLGPVPAGAFA
jgi:hypothetical protein